MSNELKNLAEYRQDFYPYASVTFASGSVVDLVPRDFVLGKTTVTDSCGANGFPLGVAVCRSLSFDLENSDDRFTQYDFEGAEINFSLKFKLSNSTEQIAFGTFYVTEPEAYGNTISVMAYDAMHKADKTADLSGITFPATAGQLYSYVCRKIGIQAYSSTFRNSGYEVAGAPQTDVTYRQLLGYISMIAAGNARVNMQGQMQILEYSQNASTQDLKHWVTLKTEKSDISITGIRLDGSEKLIGAFGYVLTVKNPLILDGNAEILTSIFNVLNGLTFRKFSGDYITHPLAEFMDPIEMLDVKNRRYQSFITDITHNILGLTDISNNSLSASRNAAIYEDAAKDALQKAENAEKNVNSKSRTFTTQPVPPYQVGDLWLNGTDIMVCIVPKAEGEEFALTDWEKRDSYTTEHTVDVKLEKTEASIRTSITEVEKSVSTLEGDTATLSQRVTATESQIIQHSNLISQKVSGSEVEEIVGNKMGNYVKTTDLDTEISQYIDDNTAQIVSAVSGEYVQKETLNNYYTVTQSNAAISQRVSESESSIRQDVSNTYATKGELSGYVTSETVETLIEASVAEGLAKIDLTAYAKRTDLDGLEESVSASLELKVSKNDNDQIVSMINASADSINLSAGRITIDSTYFKLKANGEIRATYGTVGGWNLGTSSLRSGSSVSSSVTFLSTGTEAELTIGGHTGTGWTFKSGSNFGVNANGMYCTYGKIANWEISAKHLHGADTQGRIWMAPNGIGQAMFVAGHGSDTWKFLVAPPEGANENDDVGYTGVDGDGKLFAQEAKFDTCHVFQGTIESGTFIDATIQNAVIKCYKDEYIGNGSYTQLDHNGLTIYTEDGKRMAMISRSYPMVIEVFGKKAGMAGLGIMDYPIFMAPDATAGMESVGYPICWREVNGVKVLASYDPTTEAVPTMVES